ncbi:MAG: UvrD-helicase domain-containing protein [Desulfovibrionaceae bacterium]|nr:UvrD-helicase domain-containing protein [Desulfovibrionaceae bacterium]
MMAQFTVALSSDFFGAYAKLPQSVQNKVLPLVNKFRENPAQPGLDYEKLNSVDPKLFSLRVDDTYSCIVMSAESVFVLLWVDKEEAASHWAKTHKCTVDVKTGAFQILVVPEETPKTYTERSDTELCPWAAYTDDRFDTLGVPEEDRPLLRTMQRSELAKYKDRFSALTWECLHFLLEGDSWESVESHVIEAQAKEPVDTEDFKAALHNPASFSRFMVDPKEHDLEAALEKPLEQWRVFLHPTQYTLVNRDWNGPVRVLGGAGTGKTVVAMHRARWLASQCPKEEKILFTTFSTTLAEDLRQNMSGLCTKEEMKHIEIINLDKWVYAYLKRENFHYKFCDEKTADEIWLQAVPLESKFDREFCKSEWKEIIQPQEITKFEEYIRAPRTGRGRGITRADRKLLWPIFEDFRIIMRDRQLLEQEDAMRMARERILANGKALYWSVIVDEAQDLSVQALKLLRVLVEEGKNDLFVVGDGHQRIYRNPVALKACGINITGRSKKLRINYRTTEEIRKIAASYLYDVAIDDLDGGSDDNGQYISLMHGPEPVQVKHKLFEDRISFIADTVDQMKKNSIDEKDICLSLPTNQEIERYEKALTEAGIPVFALTKGKSDNRSKPGIRLATRYRVKGLEFTVMILADWEETSQEDPKNRFLRYVAATRARQYLYILS